MRLGSQQLRALQAAMRAEAMGQWWGPRTAPWNDRALKLSERGLLVYSDRNEGWRLTPAGKARLFGPEGGR
jgi:hypothetical protein